MNIKSFILSALMLATSSFVYGQTSTESSYRSMESSPDMLTVEESDITDYPERLPEYPGGLQALMQFLGDNITYPDECVKNKIQGRVIVRFTVFKDGMVGNIKTTNPVHPLLDAEAMRVVSIMPRWTPGSLDGVPVNVWYSLPVSFKL